MHSVQYPVHLMHKLMHEPPKHLQYRHTLWVQVPLAALFGGSEEPHNIAIFWLSCAVFSTFFVLSFLRPKCYFGIKVHIFGTLDARFDARNSTYFRVGFLPKTNRIDACIIKSTASEHRYHRTSTWPLRVGTLLCHQSSTSSRCPAAIL